MPGKKITQLTVPTAKTDLEIKSTDYIPVARSGSTIRLPGASFVYDLSSTGIGTSLVASNDRNPNTLNILSVKSLSANPPIFLTDRGDNITYDLPYDDTLVFKNGKFGVNISTGGGVELGAGGLKLTPASSPGAAVLAVRPSDANATDYSWITREKVTTGNDQGVLQPYFKTFTGAINYANANFTGSYTLYVDEDCVEGTPSANGWSPLNGDNGTIIFRFFTQAEVNAAFGINSGLFAGLYCFNKQYNIANSPYTGFPWSTYSGIQGNASIFARYFRSSINQWRTERYYNEAPKKIIRRVYHDTSAIRTPPVNTNGVWSGGSLGTDKNNWLKYSSMNYPTGRGAYHGVRGFNFGNTGTTSIYNICFESITNGPDCTFIEATTGTLGLYNCTLSMGGPGCYNWGFININNNARVYSRGVLLRDPGSTNDSVPVLSFPGYGLVIKGTDTPSSPAVTTAIIKMDNDSGGFFSNWSYDAYIYNTGGGSGLMGNIILAGCINAPYGIFNVSRGQQLTTGGIFLKDTLTLTTSALDQGRTIPYYNNVITTAAVLPGQTAQIFWLGGHVNNWVYHLNEGPSVTTYTQPSLYYPLTMWSSNTTNGAVPNNGTISNGVLTYNSNIVNSSNISFSTYAWQSAKNSASALTGYIGGATANVYNDFLNVTDLYTLRSPYNNTTYTKPTYY